MKSFTEIRRSLLNPIQETTLNPDQIEKADDWAKDRFDAVSAETKTKISAAMQSGPYHHAFPLPNLGSDGNSDVIEHLGDHGWEVHDYKAGTARKHTMVGNPDRGIPLKKKVVVKKIGAVLKETGASSDLINDFANDPSRQTKNNEGLHVVISTHPHAVAGMSTGTPWSSCMNMESGINRHYLPEDIRHGTHVAYLVKKDDHEGIQNGVPENPIARIALKPFSSPDKKDTIFRPEASEYGSGGSDFQYAVSRWANDNYPAKPDVKYSKHTELYHDAGDRQYESITPEKAIKQVQSGFLPPGDYDHDVKDALVNHAASLADPVRKSVTMSEIAHSVSNLSPAHVNKLYKMTTDASSTDEGFNYFLHSTRQSLMRNHPRKLSKTNVQHILSNTPDDEIPHTLLANPHVSDEWIDKRPDRFQYLPPKRQTTERAGILAKAFKNGSQLRYSSAEPFEDKFTAEHLNDLIDGHLNRWKNNEYVDDNGGLAWSIAKSKNLTKDLHDKFVNGVVSAVPKEQPQLTPEGLPRGRKHVELRDAANSLLKSSQHATYDDIKKLEATHVVRPIQSLFANNNVPETTHKEAVERLVADHGEKFHTKLGLGGVGSTIGVPENFGKHMKDSHYDMMAKDPTTRVRFSDHTHHAKFMDASQRRLSELDDAHKSATTPEERGKIESNIHDAATAHLMMADQGLTQVKYHANDYPGIKENREALHGHIKFVTDGLESFPNLSQQTQNSIKFLADAIAISRKHSEY